MSNSLGYVIQKTISFVLTVGNFKPFISVTADELVFGYDDRLVALAHRFYPKNRRPMSKMGLLISRNGTLNEVSTIYTGHTGMHEFGLLNRINGQDKLPYWKDAPCTDIAASEGSFFPPRKFTKNNTVFVYDKDLCRILPLEYQGPTTKEGIDVDLWLQPEYAYDSSREENKCFYRGMDSYPPKGLQYIGPCQSDAPLYVSNPHFYQCDPALLDAVDGLKPDSDKHRSFFKIQPKLGVPLEGQVRIQINMKVERAQHISAVSKFRSIVYPIMWIQEGMEQVTPEIRSWIYLATTFGDIAERAVNYITVTSGVLILVTVFVKAYKNLVFTKETIEIGMKTLRRGSTFIVNGQHRLMMVRDSYTLLDSSTTDPDLDPDPNIAEV